MSIFSRIKNLFGKKPEQKQDEADFQSLFGSAIHNAVKEVFGKESYKSPLGKCPFCGGGVSTMANYEMDGTMFVMCNTCRVMVFFPDQPQTVEQIKPQWNRREIEATLRAEIARLKKGK